MSIRRLRAVLRENFTISLDGSQALADRINQMATDRRNAFLAKGKNPPTTKTAVPAPLIGSQTWSIRPIDLLRKLGQVTTPATVNLSKLSASWATRRYFWAIAEASGPNSSFRISADARGMDFHQKTLLSDEFGIGFGTLLFEKRFATAGVVDISAALAYPLQYDGIQQAGTTQPDYLMWGASQASPFYVIECKGTQSSASIAYDQLRRGLEQVPSITFVASTRPIHKYVVATFLGIDSTTIYVIDPPGEPG